MKLSGRGTLYNEKGLILQEDLTILHKQASNKKVSQNIRKNRKPCK